MMEENKFKSSLINSWNKEKINNIGEILIKEGISTINYYDKLYPKKLRNFEDSPTILFYKGNIEMLNNNKSVAIVGSRNHSYYGEM